MLKLIGAPIKTIPKMLIRIFFDYTKPIFIWYLGRTPENVFHRMRPSLNDLPVVNSKVDVVAGSWLWLRCAFKLSPTELLRRGRSCFSGAFLYWSFQLWRTFMIKVAMIGSSCAGKSTLVYSLIGRLKKQGILAEGVVSTDRKFSYPKSLLVESEDIQFIILIVWSS